MDEGSIVKFIFYLIPLLVLWGVSAWLVKMKSGQLSFSGASYLQKLDSIILSQNNSAHLVKVSDSKVLLLGASAQQTNLIASFDLDEIKPLEIENKVVPLNYFEKGLNGKTLKDKLSKFFKKEENK